MLSCRVPEILLCAFYRTHGKEMICRVSSRKHTANKKHTENGALRRVPSPMFAVCQSQAHGKLQFSPCAQRQAHGELSSAVKAPDGV